MVSYRIVLLARHVSYRIVLYRIVSTPYRTVCIVSLARHVVVSYRISHFNYFELPQNHLPELSEEKFFRLQSENSNDIVSTRHGEKSDFREHVVTSTSRKSVKNSAKFRFGVSYKSRIREYENHVSFFTPKHSYVMFLFWPFEDA